MTNNIKTLRITTLHVLDQEEAVAFYCGVLGFEVTNDVDMVVEHPYGTDFGARDPFGNSVGVAQLSHVSNEEVRKQHDARRA